LLGQWVRVAKATRGAETWEAFKRRSIAEINDLISAINDMVRESNSPTPSIAETLSEYAE
jgi:hypothetical protein